MVEYPTKFIIQGGPEPEGYCVEFRLTYEGSLYASGNNSPHSDNKHHIRKILHVQLKQLWEITPHLKQLVTKFNANLGSAVDILPDKFPVGKYRFLPLVTEELSLWCGLDILFLRPDPSGQIIKSGDIDGRVKTIFDAMRIPTLQELGGHTPGIGEDPFFCLLEDDCLISRVAVETDMLLMPIGGGLPS